MSSDPVPNRGPAVFAVTTGTLVLATVFVVARLVCRAGIVRNVSLDDYFIVLAWAVAFGLSFAIDYGTFEGLGRHDEDIPSESRNSLRRCEYVFSILYNPALMASKTSILIFYLRLSKNTEAVLRIASWGVLAIVNVAGAVLTCINIFQCNPVRAAFDPYKGSVKCIPLLTEFICSAPINVVTDLAILALPLPVLTGMRLPRRQKIILIMTFTVGVFVAIVDVVRIYYLQRAISRGASDVLDNPEATFGEEPEFAWNASLSLMWSAVEVNVGIACACVPTLKPLIIRILPAMIIDPDGTRRGSDSANGTKRSRLSPLPENGQNSTSQSSPDEGSLPPPAPSYGAGNMDQEMSGLEFITTPDMNMTGSRFENSIERQPTGLQSIATTSGEAGNSIYFGFVNMKRPKSMIRTNVRDSFKYCTIVTILFFIWGFSYGLLNTLNNAVAAAAHMSTAETLGLTTIYFGAGYFFGPLLVGEWLLRHDEHRRVRKKRSGSQAVGGFKATFMVGLSIYGIGTIMFWPSAVLLSFAGFMICNLVVGFGLAVLETAANPFLALCGPMDYAEMRLLLAQGVQGIATVVSQVLAQKVFFTDINASAESASKALLEVQWTYLAITLFCAALALFFYYAPLPEVTDAEMQNSTRYLPVDPKRRSFAGLQLRTWTLILAVAAQWTYVAGQESMSIFFRNLLTPPSGPDQSSSSHNTTRVRMPTFIRMVNSPQTAMGSELTVTLSDYLLIAQGAFTVSRFYTAYLAYLSPTHPRVPQPRTVLSIHTGLSIVCAILIVALKPTDPDLLVIPIILFYFFEGPIWPLIFALGLRGQGSRTKRAAAFLTMGASGPAFWPFVMYAIHNEGGSYQTAFAIVPALLVLTGAFSLFLDLKSDAGDLVDARVGATEQRKIQDRANREMELDAIMAQRRQTSRVSSRRASDADPERGSIANKVSRVLTRGSSALTFSRRSSVLPGTEEPKEERTGGST